MDSVVHGVIKSRTRQSDFHFHFSLSREGCCDFEAVVRPPALFPKFSPSLLAFQPSEGSVLHPSELNVALSFGLKIALFRSGQHMKSPGTHRGVTLELLF